MGKVILFPKEKSKRVQKARKADMQKLMLSLSLMSLVLMTVFITDQISRRERPTYIVSGSPDQIEKLNRAIASAQPMDIMRDIEWEHDLAKKLSDLNNRQPANAQQKVSALDQLRFGEFEGNYRFAMISDPQSNKSYVHEIEFVENDEIQSKPVLFKKNPVDFLNQYKQAFIVPFEKAEIEPDQRRTASTEKNQTYKLLNSAGQKVGVAQFGFDNSGHLLKLKVQPK